jgi:hypothetical protein
MLQVALNLKDAILEYYDNYLDSAYARDSLTDENWAHTLEDQGILGEAKDGNKGSRILEPVS